MNPAAGERESGRDVDRPLRPVRVIRAQVLARHGRRRAHQSDRGPRHQGEELGVDHRIGRLGGGALRQGADEPQQEHAADVHRDALDAGGQAESEELPDDLPVGRVGVALGDGDDPAAAPELHQRVQRHEPRGDHRPHRRAGGPERRDGTQARDQDEVEHQVEHGGHDAEHHRRPGVPRGAERAAQHVEHQHPAAEQEHDAEEGERLRLHRGLRVHQVEQGGGEHIAEWRDHQDRQTDGGEERLVHGAVDLVGVSRTGEAGHQHTHAREQRVDEDDDDDDELPRHADGGVAGVTHQVANEDVIHDALEAAEDVGEHGGPGELPDRPAQRPLDDGAVVALRSAHRPVSSSISGL